MDEGTTSLNKSYHSYVWSLCPKTQFHSAQYVRNAASLGAILYNDDYLLQIVKLLGKCGICNAISACLRMLNLMNSQ
ncbi:unnamed protein product [Rotaria sordida]|uniref:Uncharacterized protein n=1 Tax=Rotaria sordida TaxID=392033 RepID=A0A819INU6_9BILA|nr:unnamed protein product [Rotaria sordida]CAF1361518.1 unnamed protein product [Rotaria sordida]CAF3815202.1 unnamed protein product [Rotaria sordida]CAF3917535.1 unnamed protein product [Rotaria sordida]